MAAGEPLGITPYGTEAMHVLRAEKGYPIIGQETDGTVTPQDLGHGWAVLDEEGVHRPAVASAARRQRADRKQLVGLLPVDPDALLPEGAQLVAPDADLGATPVPMLGHVTSSYRSAALGRTFALALVKGGRDRIGERVLAPLVDGDVEAEIVDRWCSTRRTRGATGSRSRDASGTPRAFAARRRRAAGARPRAAVPRPGRPAGRPGRRRR